MRKQNWCVPCLRGAIGDWVYYSALMRPEQIASRIETSKNIREAEALDDFLQRTLKVRYGGISRYLLQRDDRFFNSLIIGVFGGLPNWVQFDLDAMAKELDLPEIVDVEESLGLLIFDGQEKMFAIDGQHRAKGIATAFEKNPERFKKDEYSVLFVAHKDDKLGKVRTRRLFCDINKNAVAVSEGDKVIIDEDDLFAIVTRRIFAGYKHFDGGKQIAISETKSQLTQDGTERFTSLLALHTACKSLKTIFKKAPNTNERAIENVDQFQEVVTRFFDFVIENEPSFDDYFNQKSTTLTQQRERNRNLFFRPVGLEVLARLYAHFYIKGRLRNLAFALKSDTVLFENPGGIWDGILWNNGRIEASAKVRNVAIQLTLYLLHETDTTAEATLLNDLRDVRKDPDYQLPVKVALPDE